jgi:glyoxylase-like metal-dependent hydrolase (beta-lactamase superfamily II)
MVLGEIAESFGRYTPVTEKTCIPHTQAHVDSLAVIETPGHAPHHLSFSYKGNLFAGEACGNYYSVGDTDYLRPATPPKFFLDVFLGSLDRLMALGVHHIRYAHFGDAPNSCQMIERFHAQILRWKEMIQEEMSGGSDDLLTRCMDHLLEQDPDLAGFKHMDPETQDREKFFAANSIRGFIDFLQDAR